MIDFSDINTVSLSYFFMASVLSFTICISIFSTKTISRDIWIISNIIGIIGIFFFTNIKNENYVDIGASLTVFSGALKSIAFSNKKFLFRRYIFGNLFFALSSFCAFIITFYPDVPFRRNYFLFGMLFSLAASLIFLLKNREWYGLKQKGYVVATFSLGIISILFVVAQNIPYDPNLKLVDISARGVANFMALCVASVAIQLIFLSLIFGQSERLRVRALRRNTRLLYDIQLKQATLVETQALAEERQNLIKMLTHEVRQPLNTAQAALQSIATDVATLKMKDVGIQAKLNNTITVLNAITLSISNSLVGATLISNRRKPQLESINICDISQLAFLDVDPKDQHRIHMQFAQPFFAEVDPVILRLALRNLLENAVKYSPAGTPIVFKIKADEDRLTIQFAVSNRIIDKAMLDGDIFARNKRGVDSRYNGDGLGLFIVNEVTKMHGGLLDYNIAGDEVTFQLEIPA